VNLEARPRGKGQVQGVQVGRGVQGAPVSEAGQGVKGRFLAILFLAVLLLLAWQPLSLVEAGGSTFQFTYYPHEDIRFHIGGGMLTAANLPNTEAYGSLFLFVRDLNGQAHIEEHLLRGENGSVSVSISDLRDGDYYVELYYFLGGDEFTSYIFGDGLRFRWQSGVGLFWESPALARNRMIFEAARRDNSALAHYLSPSYYIQSRDAAIVKLAHEITEGLKSDYEKALAIHNWICTNLWYDSDVVSDNSKRAPPDAVSTLNNRRGVCEGYANLYAALLRAVHIPAKIVIGFGMDPSMQGGWTARRLSGAEVNHSWN